ncbi:uncharacterized protein LOC132066200 [Lycium ferocissimum]|uniref:uncharacterized protein LOC132066200 n=1 Tax=Lycium ferocissimum TaxID=112874 RepID=UPI0028150740|nr:uncharacterized protein LOC132066200 [Lycium ferocissimum]
MFGDEASVSRKLFLHPPPDFNGFDRLVSLELYEVTITSKSLESLVNHSPLLERLVLQELYIQDHIQVNAAKLRYFNFTDSIISVSLKNVPLLEELSLWDPKSSENAGESDISNVVQSLATGAGEVPTRLPCAFNRLGHLRLSDISLRELDEVSGAFCLIRSCPYLHDMEIKVFHDDDSEIPALDSLESFADVTFNHLRTVKLEGIIGTKLEMQLIKLLLAKAPVLIRMQIEPGVGDNSPQTRLQVLVELTRFRRASTEAVVYNLTAMQFDLIFWQTMILAKSALAVKNQ